MSGIKPQLRHKGGERNVSSFVTMWPGTLTHSKWRTGCLGWTQHGPPRAHDNYLVMWLSGPQKYSIRKSQLDKWSWLWRLGLVKWFPSDLYNIKRWCEENVCIAKGLLWNCGLNESIKHTRYSLHVPKCTTGGHKIINTCRREVGGGAKGD